MLVACGGGAPLAPEPPDAGGGPSQEAGADSGVPDACTPSCAGKSCGNDGCGGSCGACPSDGGTDAGVADACVPSCAGKTCGDDGCGGSCGTCPPIEPGCPDGGTCTYLQRTAWSYACVAPDACEKTGVIGLYGTYEACQSFGCMNGNSRCGDQFGNTDADRWACERCRVTCNDGEVAVCGIASQTAEGCVLQDGTWGAYIAPCICR